MPREDYKRCRYCGRHARVVGPLSHTRQCGDCARANLVANIDGLHFHERPTLARWRRGVVAGVLKPEYVDLLDELGAFGALDDAETAA